MPEKLLIIFVEQQTIIRHALKHNACALCTIVNTLAYKRSKPLYHQNEFNFMHSSPI